MFGGQTTDENLGKIQTLQNKLLKVLYYKKYHYSTNKLHNELEILKFNDLIKQETISFVYPYVHGKLPSVFGNQFSHRHELTEMIEVTRTRRFILPRYNNDICKSTIQYVGNKMFNEQAQQVKLRISIKTFRKYVKKLYMTQYEGETPLISLIKYCMFSFSL